MFDLDAIDSALRTRLQGEVKLLRQVIALSSEAELEERSEASPVAYTLIRGARFNPPRGWGDEQKGLADVMVWLRTRSVAVPSAAANTVRDGAYALTTAAIAALNGYIPVQDTALHLVECGLYKMRSAYEVTYALRFQLAVSVLFPRTGNPP